TFDCIANCIEDADDVANETRPDCNSNGIPDECDLFNPSLDCDQNGVPDECEDCNNNGIGDACEFIEQFDDSSSQLSPIGLGADVNYVFLAPPQALGDVTIDFLAIADLGGAFKYLNLTINGADYFRVFDDPNTQNCPLTPDTDQLIIPMAEFNTLLGSGDLTFDLVADGPLPFPCNGSDPWVSIDLSYAAPAAVGDVNENGIPDECDYARGDNNLDGVVDVNDLLNLLAKWGLCAAPCTEDTDLDGDVDVDDLLSLLAGWG
ncbi:MAG: hypothetical protein O7G85_03750, partial [Planctomycetota bacterium]|nr:hypothetical protein [Planctomycetota bacterium]